MNSVEIRKRFLSWFAERGHAVLPSSSLVPANDPTLFFTNAGMVQFKDIFTGAQRSEHRRATTSQKCMRVSGKHNDLENVGRTRRHHTLFEMLGNFSFGDYFKEEAIPFAWDLLTRGYGIEKERLWVTIFESDDEAAEIWMKKVGVPAERVQRLGAKDNFWSMGDTGPCGPCTEIHYDFGPEISDDTRGPAGGDDRYVEIWNLVFMQYDQAADGTRTNLPRPSIDTGMGLERLATVLQRKLTNYDTDLFQPLIQQAAELSGVPYGRDAEHDVAMRVIADHARAAAFLVADGVMPSNEERGYVLRRVMRRAIRYGVKLGMSKPFLYKSADRVVSMMGADYPELIERRSFIQEVIRGEEERFSETLDKGLALLDRELEQRPAVLHGDVVFKLHDTFGFPTDLTELIAAERGIEVDMAGYKTSMEAQKAKARASWKGSGEQAVPELHRELANIFDATEFLGYTAEHASATVQAILRDGERVASLEAGERGQIIVSETPFYAESGGQVGDHGEILFDGGRFEVTDTQKGHGDLVVHIGQLIEGTLRESQKVRLVVDSERRDRTRLNHTATHLLHAALRQVLGDHVMQKGSSVDPNRLRFDFSHHKPMTAHELQEVEEIVYRNILANEAVSADVMPIEEARALGAMALFGEKYGDNVRVIRVGDYSKELCGGTHTKRSGDIGLFRVLSESGVAAGVRRVEAVTGIEALRFTRERDAGAAAAADRLRVPVQQLDDAVERLQSDRRRLEKELEAARRELARATAGDVLARAKEINGVKVLALEIPGDATTLRDEADRLRDQLGSGLVVLGSRSTGAVLVIAAATKDLAGKRVHAGNIVRELARMVGGGGGGRPDMAQAGGPNIDALPDALERVYALVQG
ncbi:MAG: alanine--tRNA ligase [Deltaproteobacteria bacterium]|nr:alanine--tRNA ligase [Deltaproteobacteria bacterium]